MYFEERIFNGILHWRNNPKAEFKPYTMTELSERLVRMKKQLATGHPDARERDMRGLITAGDAAPSTTRYEVVYPQEHKSLEVGDVVVMTITPDSENVLLRLLDMTLHELEDSFDQYVLLRELTQS